ncbi:hypothetical protein LEL_10756 [Akanthomyces lecanii RCEF 1005]|uniref:Uncharacterized protein n=1 Tax=Akanthomyces lecanii RCEF 1005 TaxID=1081108 RepID=A0A167UHN1_CORDF|nr:hypothetical protein LEL_10756 [Akanthomyces lecanii RCEF 1005]
MENLIQPSETTSTQNGEAATPNNQHEADTEMVGSPESINAPPPQVNYHLATDEDNAMVDAENERTHSKNVAPEEEESADAQDAGTEVYTSTENYDNEEANDEEIDEENNIGNNDEGNEEDADDITPEREETQHSRHDEKRGSGRQRSKQHPASGFL